MEDWSIVTELITPGNLRKLGNPDYTTIAACLGDDILTSYSNGPAKSGDDNLKVYSYTFLKF